MLFKLKVKSSFKKMTQNCVCFQTLSVSPGNCSAVGGKMPNTETAVACPPIHDFKQNRVLHQ